MEQVAENEYMEIFDREVNFNWNDKNYDVPAELDSVAKKYGGLAYEFVMPDVNPMFRVFRIREKGSYLIYEGSNLLSDIAGDGAVVSF